MSRVAIAPAGVIGPEGDSGQHLPLNVKLVHTLGFAYDFHKRADSWLDLDSLRRFNL
jgi:hypothetical protein